MQADPIGLAGGLNLYSYVGGNPLSYVDPSGEVAGQIVLGAFVIGGLAIATGAWKPTIPGKPKSEDPGGIPGFSSLPQSKPVPMPWEIPGSGNPGQQLPCKLVGSGKKLTQVDDPAYPGGKSTLLLCEYECNDGCGNKFRFVKAIPTGSFGCSASQFPGPDTQRLPAP